MKFQVKKVRGVQAHQALHNLGLVKIVKSSARDLYDMGIPVTVIGNKVNSYHFFKGWHLAMTVDSREHEGARDFDRLVRDWSNYNENPETGKIAFFVDKKHIAGKRR